MPTQRYRVSIGLLVSSLLLGLSVTAAAAGQRTDFGTLLVQMRPPDADVFIDGERWVASEGSGTLRVQLPPGYHRVEIRAPGRQTYVSTVTIRVGETTPLNVALTQAEAAPPPPLEPPPPKPRYPAPRPPAAPSGGIVQTTTPEDGFVVAPDFRVTEINHETSQLVGVYGGYVFGGQFLVGAGGYWQANSIAGTHIAYGGPVFEWRLFPESTIGLNLHGLIGGGWRYFDYGYGYSDGRVDHHGTPVYFVPYHRFDDGFFVAEPEAQVVVRFGASLRLQAGVGYRATSSSGLNGASGSVSVQFGR